MLNQNCVIDKHSFSLSDFYRTGCKSFVSKECSNNLQTTCAVRLQNKYKHVNNIE